MLERKKDPKGAKMCRSGERKRRKDKLCFGEQGIERSGEEEKINNEKPFSELSMVFQEKISLGWVWEISRKAEIRNLIHP